MFVFTFFEGRLNSNKMMMKPLKLSNHSEEAN